MIPVFRPSYGPEELEALREPLESGWVGPGPKTQEFEARFAQFTGAKHAIGVQSCSAALHLALKVLGVQGAEVVTTPLTFVSTNHAILYNHARPVFADIEYDTLNIDVKDIERKISPRTKAIMIVDFGGHPCEMDDVAELARKHGLPVVEDAAHACGAEYKGRRVGTLSTVTSCSFHAVKNVAMGMGGALTLDDPHLDQRLRKLRWMGASKSTWDRTDPHRGYSWYYVVEEVGYNYVMDDLHAALGLVQLAKLDKTNGRRREIVGRYNEGLAGLEWVERPVEKPYVRSALHNYVIKAERRDDLMAFLSERGISTSVHYYPNHLYAIYKEFYAELPVAEGVWKKLVTLPLYPDLTDQQVDMIVEAIWDFYKKTF